MKMDILFSLGLLERAQNLVSNTDGIGHAFQSRSELLKFVVSEITVSRTGRENEVVVRHRHLLAIRIVHKHAPPRLIYPGHLAHDHRRILVSSQYFPDWRTHLRRR